MDGSTIDKQSAEMMLLARLAGMQGQEPSHTYLDSPSKLVAVADREELLPTALEHNISRGEDDSHV